jgi:hypothetical protein
MGMRPSSQVFTRLLKPVQKYLKQIYPELITNFYQDDLLLLHKNQTYLHHITQEIFQLLNNLGFDINIQKSILKPTQQLQYLGIQINTKLQMLSLPRTNQGLLKKTAKKLATKTYNSRREIAALIGRLEFLRQINPNIAPFMRPLHQFIRSTRTHKWDTPIPNKSIIENLTLWSQIDNKYFKYNILHNRLPPIQTDASPLGYGIVTPTRYFNITDPNFHSLTSNHRELTATCQAIHHTAQHNHHCIIPIQTDNTTAVAYLKKLAGPIPHLHNTVAQLHHILQQKQIRLEPTHRPGILMHTPDHLSRKQHNPIDWTIDHNYLQNILQKLQIQPTWDLFASPLSNQFHNYITWAPHPHHQLRDALNIDWDKLQGTLYAFPPIHLLPRTIHKIIHHKKPIVLIHPAWTHNNWSHLIHKTPHQTILLQKPQHILHLPKLYLRHHQSYIRKTPHPQRNWTLALTTFYCNTDQHTQKMNINGKHY